MTSENHVSLAQQISKSHPDDQKLMAAYGSAGLLSLVGAFALAAILVAIKTPAFGLPRGELYYRMLTGTPSSVSFTGSRLSRRHC
jgi:hypothetical protein